MFSFEPKAGVEEAKLKQRYPAGVLAEGTETI